MKTIDKGTILFIGIALLVASCHKNNVVECGNYKEFAVSIRDVADYNKYPTQAPFSQTEPMVSVGYSTYRQNDTLYAVYGLNVAVDHVCSGYTANSDAVLLLKHPDTSVVFQVLESADNPIANTLYVYRDSAYYHSNVSRSNPKSIGITARVQFVSFGSYTLDSSYFFSNLDFMHVGLTYKEGK